ncbi:unnamed protein product [Adineta steineri]|uniref:Uncharacterized protein n=1 Tax=Adineta steineri TaxID=433720 RepID=A0A813MAW9_9BILA|nr:unnamed protein product [Adineta steineri]CAF0881796.1 unnamed protein product [Adineta steineri]CAF0892706.1 unnamed protein product [Adineta steineri]
MSSDGSKACAIILLAFLFAIGASIYYSNEIKEYFDNASRPSKIIYRKEVQVNAFLIKKYIKPGTHFHNKITIHAANDSDGTELYRINWDHSLTMTLTRIEDGFVVSRAQRLNDLSYSFELFGQLAATGKMTRKATNETFFMIEYASDKYKTWEISMTNSKKDIEFFFIVCDWDVVWWDLTTSTVYDKYGIADLEMIDFGQRAHLQHKSNMNGHALYGPVPNPYIYDLYVLKYLPDEFYLTTMIVGDHILPSDCKGGTEDWSSF